MEDSSSSGRLDAARYVQLAESAPALLAVFDEALRFDWLNASWARHLGWSFEHLRGTAVTALVHPDDLAGFLRWARCGPDEHAPRVVRTRFAHRDGQHRWIDWFVDPMARTRLLYAREVNDVVAAEQMLARQLQLMTLAEEVSGVGHWTLHVTSQTVFWSPAIYRIHGVDPQTYSPTLEQAVNAYHPEDRGRVAEVVAAAIADGTPFEFELRIVRPDGEIRHVLSRGQCDVDVASGTSQVLFGTLLDVTERDRRRDRQAREHRLLTTGMLAAGISHELKNPLTFVSANVELIAEEIRALAGPSPSARMVGLLEMLADAREGTDRINQLSRSLRAFVREDAPLLPTDALAAVRTAMSMSAHDIRHRATCELDAVDVPMVEADESRLSQVLVSLIRNAAQAFPTRDPVANRIAIRVAPSADGRVHIDVYDNGPGIPPSVLPRIFEPFFTTKPVSEGTGLGLAMSQSIIEAFGGELSCVETGRRGTTFRVRLPVASDVDASADITAAIPAAGVSRGRVVVIDDEESLVRAMQRVLQREMDVEVFSDSRAALAYLCQVDHVDLILCDLIMPHLDGMQLFAALRSARPDLASRVAFVSGGFGDDAIRDFLLGVDNERLEKPFDFAQLRAMARRAVRERTDRSATTRRDVVSFPSSSASGAGWDVA